MTELIKTFEVQLDLDDCKSLYDCIREERYERPEAGWDLTSIISRVKRSPEDVQRSSKTAAFQLRLVLAHMDKGFFEKQKKVDDDQSQSILSSFFTSELRQPSLPFWLFPVFKPGDTVKGKVSLELTNPIEAENVRLEFFGAARTRVRVYTGRGYRNYHGREDYIKVKSLMWLRNGSRVEKDVIQSPSMMIGDALNAGYMQFPFQFQIPSYAPPTVPPLVIRGANYAYLSYFMKATVNKGKLLKRGNIVCHQPLWVDRPVELSRNPRDLTRVEIQETKKVGFFNANNIINCTVSIPKTAFLRSEEIQVLVMIENNSGTAISKVVSCIEITGAYTASRRCCQRTRRFVHRGVECQSGEVNSGMCPHFRLDTPQKFTTINGTLVPACPMDDSRLISVAYQVHVEVYIEGAHLNMHVRIPIKVATHSSSYSKSGTDGLREPL